MSKYENTLLEIALLKHNIKLLKKSNPNINSSNSLAMDKLETELFAKKTLAHSLKPKKVPLVKTILKIIVKTITQIINFIK